MAAAARPVLDRAPVMDFSGDALDSRYALVNVAKVTPEDRTIMLQAIADAMAQGMDVSAAVHTAKLRLRDTWKPPKKGPPRIPGWAAFVLRGAP